MHRLGERHERGLRVRPRVEVHERVLANPPRNIGPIRRDALDASVVEIGHVVELRNVDDAGPREFEEQALSPARAPGFLP